MPRHPETIERFILHVPVTAEQLGPAVVALSRMGLDNLRHELVTDVVTFKSRNRQRYGVSGEDFILAWTKEHPTFRAIEMVKHFEAHGRSGGSAYPAISDLMKRKQLKRVGKGEYAVSSPKALPKPAKHAKPDMDRREISHTDFILRLASRNHGRFSTAWMKQQFEKDGRKWAAVSPSIATVLGKKLIKRVGDGEYVLLAKAAKVKKASKPVTRKTNGSASIAAVAAEVANG